MTAETRRLYGFNQEQRQYAHDRAGMGLKTGELAGGKCEFPGEECFKRPEPKVSHMEGVFISWLDHKDPRGISDVTQNGLMQCPSHNAYLDSQQAFQVACLKGERLREFPKSGTIYDRNRHHRIKRRRHRR